MGKTGFRKLNQRLEDARLPVLRETMDWTDAEANRLYHMNVPQIEDPREPLKEYISKHKWVFPKKPVCFITDVHADADAFVRSLSMCDVASYREVRGEYKFKLRKLGKATTFILGGDCFDKGPSNLRLLRTIKNFIDAGAKVELLAGNHDFRTLIGLQYKGSKNPKHAHLFTRMGKKTMPLFREILSSYNVSKDYYPDMTEEELDDYFFPGEEWFEQFPPLAKGWIHEKKLEKELARIREKVSEIKVKLNEYGMSLADIYAAMAKGRELFLSPKGEFHWFFKALNLTSVKGSFIFVHAGLDDDIVPKVCSLSPAQMRSWFRKEVKEQDPFDLYHGSIGNCFRTKYRSYDKVLSGKGIQRLHKNKIHAIVHGHLNLLTGQRMVLRDNMLNLECDCSLDRNTRREGHLQDRGAAFTWINPDKTVYAYSCDSPYLKELQFG